MRIKFLTSLSCIKKAPNFSYSNIKSILKRAYYKPPNLCIGVTWRCNFKCHFCQTHSFLIPEGDYSHKKNSIYCSSFLMNSENFVMPLNVYQNLIEEYAKMGGQVIDISGFGEPLLHRDIVEMVKIAHENHILSHITTNGSLLTETLLFDLVQAGLDSITMSLCEVDEEQFLQIHGISHKEQYDKVMEALNLLSLIYRKNPQFSISINIVVNRINVSNLEKIIHTCKKYDLNNIQISPYKRIKQDLSFFLSSEDVATVLTIIQKEKVGDERYFFEIWKQINVPDRPKLVCYTPEKISVINSNGDVFPCCDCKYILGNIKEQSFSKIWKSANYKKFRKYMKSHDFSNSELSQGIKIMCECERCADPMIYQLNQ